MLLSSVCGTIHAESTIHSDFIVISSGLNELSVRNSINQYFTDRTSFLQDTSISTFSSAIEGIITDENSHRNILGENGLTFIASSIIISEIHCGDTYAVATVIEEVTYSSYGNSGEDTITHELMLFLNEDSIPYVTSDRYLESYSGFHSCSYVSSGEETELNATYVGGKNCIAVVAEGQVGYTEGAYGYTKYGEWYETNIDSSANFSHLAWCAMFVSWCANEANIPSSIIPRKARVTDFASHYNYNLKSTPQVGDFAIFTNYDHIGIVTAVSSSGSTFTVVDGNNGGTNGVARNSFTTNDTSIIGFLRPAYTVTLHSYSWHYDANYHWGVCVNCGYTSSKTSHSYSNSSCITCGCPDDYNYVNSASKLTD